MNNIILNEIDEHINTANLMYGLENNILLSARMCLKALKNGKKILIFGNGGSAADAQHIAAELVGRYKVDRKALPAIALTTDSSALTSIGNDFGYKNIFIRQVESLALEGDIVIGLSTSGSSENVIGALNKASSLGCKTIGLCGLNKDLMKETSDIVLSISSTNTPRIQEMHILIGHIICHLIDLEFQT